MINTAKIIEDTQSLIRIDSQNPGIQEAQCSAWVAERFKTFGLKPEVVTVQPGRQNLTFTIPGAGKAPRLVLLGHLEHPGILVLLWLLEYQLHPVFL